jgi:hypothetical protein
MIPDWADAVEEAYEAIERQMDAEHLLDLTTSLRQELLERAEAHEEAEARYRAAKDFGQGYEDLQNDLEQF